MEYEFKLSDENYTPEELVSEVRHVLGVIDLDPASCAQAQAIIQATNYFSAEKNPEEAFNTPWRGRVFLNPPYSRGEVTKWLSRLGAQLCDGWTKAAVVITSNDTTAKWFQFIAFQRENPEVFSFGDESLSLVLNILRFKIDRDHNAGINLRNYGLKELGLGQPESKPVEKTTAVSGVSQNQVASVKQEASKSLASR